MLTMLDFTCRDCRHANHMRCEGGGCMCTLGNHPSRLDKLSPPATVPGDAFNRASGGG